MIKLKSLIKEYTFTPDPKINKNGWVRTVWPFDSEYAKKAPPVWAKKFGKGIVYLLDDANFSYVSSFGPDSELSYSGCFYGMGVKDLDMAKKLLDYRIPTELGRTSYNLIKRHMNQMIGNSDTIVNI